MPLRDIKNNIQTDLAFYAAITTATTTNGMVLDTQGYDGGVMFSFAALAWTDGTYTPLIQEDDAIGMGTATTVPADQLIGTAAEVATALGAATTLGAAMVRLGIKSTKRYVRLQMVSTGASAHATIAAVATKIPSTRPGA
jgi:hypothetical protein